MTYWTRSILSFITFNLGWWLCALGASHGYPLLGPALLPLWIGLHLWYSPFALGEIFFLGVLGLVGFLLDTLLIRCGLFAVIPESSFAPGWLMGMWLLFGQTFEGMLALRKHLWWLCLSAALTGPLSYYAGETMNILIYQRPLWIVLLIHGLIWAVLTPVLFSCRDGSLWLASRWSRTVRDSTARPEAAEAATHSAAAPADP